jgi:hypothetical protein
MGRQRFLRRRKVGLASPFYRPGEPLPFISLGVSPGFQEISVIRLLRRVSDKTPGLLELLRVDGIADFLADLSGLLGGLLDRIEVGSLQGLLDGDERGLHLALDVGGDFLGILGDGWRAGGTRGGTPAPPGRSSAHGRMNWRPLRPEAQVR